MAHLSSIVDSDDSSEFEGFTSADISEANRKWNKTNSFVDNDSFSDSDSDINEPESEILIQVVLVKETIPQVRQKRTIQFLPKVHLLRKTILKIITHWMMVQMN